MFKTLRILSTVFKIYAFVMVYLMLVGVVGLFVATGLPGPQRIQALFNLLLGGSLFFLFLYGLGEIIRLLLQIESQTRKEG